MRLRILDGRADGANPSIFYKQCGRLTYTVETRINEMVNVHT